MPPNGLGFTRRHRPNCRWSVVTLNAGLIGGRVQAVLARPYLEKCTFNLPWISDVQNRIEHRIAVEVNLPAHLRACPPIFAFPKRAVRT